MIRRTVNEGERKGTKGSASSRGLRKPNLDLGATMLESVAWPEDADARKETHRQIDRPCRQDIHGLHVRFTRPCDGAVRACGPRCWRAAP